ncbi:MAG: alpha/beta fold hydrolase [Trueperaceae bacterium]
MRHVLLAVVLLLGLAACVPVVENFGPEPIIGGATFAMVPFDPPAATSSDDATWHTAYEVLGRGRPVVMIHGIGGGSSLFQYRFNAPEVASAGYRVYALDLVGFGRSTRPAVRLDADTMVAQVTAFLEDVVGEPAVLVANGLSAAHAIRVAATHPELVSGLVLIGPTGYERLARPQTPARERSFELLRGPLGELLTSFLVEEDGQLYYLSQSYADPASLTPEVRASFDTNLKAPGARWVVFSFVTGNLDQDVSDLWPRTSQPSLIVFGTEPSFTRIEDAEPFLAARPDARFLPLAGAKVLPNEERAEAFNEAVLAFLTEIDW